MILFSKLLTDKSFQTNFFQASHIKFQLLSQWNESIFKGNLEFDKRILNVNKTNKNAHITYNKAFKVSFIFKY